MLTGNKLISSLEKRIFQLLSFLLPTQLALHLWPDWSFIFGIRVDYLSPAIYLTDLLVLTMLVLWMLRAKLPKRLSLRKIIFPTLLAIYAFLNIYFAIRPEVALARWVKIFGFLLLGLYIVRNKKFELHSWLLKPFKFSLAFISLIGIVQFILQRTIGGPLYFFGERSFTALTPGIALTSIFGKEFMRSYSIFSHPNSFAGFLLVSFVLVFLKDKKLGKWDVLILILVLFAIILSFSAAVYVAALALLGLKVFGVSKNLTKERVKKGFLFLVILASIALPVFSQELLAVGSYEEGVEKRLILAKASGETFSKNPFFGVGLNNFVVSLPDTSIKSQFAWELQPVHNLFLLPLSEGGLVGLLIFMVLIYRAFVKKSDMPLSSSLYAILMTGFVDHYWFTLQQNLLLATFVVALLFKD